MFLLLPNNIFIESAIFNPIVVRKSAKAVELSTDASKRFERFVDPEMAKIALNLLSGLIIKYAGGKAYSDILEADSVPKNKDKILLNINKCNQFLGTNLIESDIELILNKLNIDYKKNKDNYTCTPPSYRWHDIKRDVDIYEEIARVWGYNKIKNSNNFSIN